MALAATATTPSWVLVLVAGVTGLLALAGALGGNAFAAWNARRGDDRADQRVREQRRADQKAARDDLQRETLLTLQESLAGVLIAAMRCHHEAKRYGPDWAPLAAAFVESSARLTVFSHRVLEDGVRRAVDDAQAAVHVLASSDPGDEEPEQNAQRAVDVAHDAMRGALLPYLTVPELP